MHQKLCIWCKNAPKVVHLVPKLNQKPLNWQKKDFRIRIRKLINVHCFWKAIRFTNILLSIKIDKNVWKKTILRKNSPNWLRSFQQDHMSYSNLYSILNTSNMNKFSFYFYPLNIMAEWRKTSCITNQARDFAGRGNMVMNGWTNGPTNGMSHRGACSRLEINQFGCTTFV
jgi:hypothetical protein